MPVLPVSRNTRTRHEVLPSDKLTFGMQVLLADEYGFCFGVERAVDMVEDALEEGDTVRSLGPLIQTNRKWTGSANVA